MPNTLESDGIASHNIKISQISCLGEDPFVSLSMKSEWFLASTNSTSKSTNTNSTPKTPTKKSSSYIDTAQVTSAESLSKTPNSGTTLSLAGSRKHSPPSKKKRALRFPKRYRAFPHRSLRSLLPSLRRPILLRVSATPSRASY